MSFVLPLLEEKVKPHQVTALHLLSGLAFAGAGALLNRYYPPASVWSLPLLVLGIALLIAAMFRNKWLTKEKVNRVIRVVELIILLCLTGFFAVKAWTPPAIMMGVLCAAVLFSIFWENKGDGLSVIVDETGIKLPVTSRKRFIAWQDVEQAMMKYGILTIDCADNRLFQWNVGKIDFELESFNTFCFAHVEAGRKKRDANDW